MRELTRSGCTLFAKNCAQRFGIKPLEERIVKVSGCGVVGGKQPYEEETKKYTAYSRNAAGAAGWHPCLQCLYPETDLSGKHGKSAFHLWAVCQDLYHVCPAQLEHPERLGQLSGHPCREGRTGGAVAGVYRPKGFLAVHGFLPVQRAVRVLDHRRVAGHS